MKTETHSLVADMCHPDSPGRKTRHPAQMRAGWHRQNGIPSERLQDLDRPMAPTYLFNDILRRSGVDLQRSSRIGP